MSAHRCAAHCQHSHSVSRRQFVATASASMLAGSVVGNRMLTAGTTPAVSLKPQGPASQCTPKVRACFVRREGEYAMRWPGQIYDGKAARKKYVELIRACGESLGIDIDLREVPVHSPAEADRWLAESVEAKPDGLLVVLLDRQEHAWPTAVKAVDTEIPTVVFSPIGSSFTTNTVQLARRAGCFICSTDDFRQVEYGLKMLGAAAKMRATRCLVLQGRRTADAELPHLGIKLRYKPANTFLEAYEKTPVTDDVLRLAKGDPRRRAADRERDGGGRDQRCEKLPRGVPVDGTGAVRCDHDGLSRCPGS